MLTNSIYSWQFSAVIPSVILQTICIFHGFPATTVLTCSKMNKGPSGCCDADITHARLRFVSRLSSFSSAHGCWETKQHSLSKCLMFILYNCKRERGFPSTPKLQLVKISDIIGRDNNIEQLLSLRRFWEEQPYNSTVAGILGNRVHDRLVIAGLWQTLEMLTKTDWQGYERPTLVMGFGIVFLCIYFM